MVVIASGAVPVLLTVTVRGKLVVFRTWLPNAWPAAGASVRTGVPPLLTTRVMVALGLLRLPEVSRDSALIV